MTRRFSRARLLPYESALVYAADRIEDLSRRLHCRTQELQTAHTRLMELPKHEAAAIRKCDAHWLRTCLLFGAATLIVGVFIGRLWL